MSNRNERVWSCLPIHKVHQSAWADIDAKTLRIGDWFWQSMDYRGRRIRLTNRIPLEGGSTVYVFTTIRGRALQLTEAEVAELIPLAS